MQDNKIFYPIKGFEGIYEISKLGLIRSVTRTLTGKGRKGVGIRKYTINGRKMKPSTDKDGYCVIALTSHSGKHGMFKVHRLIAATFIPNPNNLPLINHINAIRNDNRIENLEWCTHKYNEQHRYKMGYISKSRKMSVDVVVDIYTNTAVGKRGEITKMMRKHGVTKIMVIQLIYNRTYIDITKDLIQPYYSGRPH